MRQTQRRRPTAALVISIIALFVALGGSSYAAFRLPNSSVGTKQLKNGAVTTRKLKNGAITAAKLNVTGVTVPNALHANSSAVATEATHATDASNAANAGALGGSPPSAFEKASSILTAVVTDNGTTAAVVRGTAGVTAKRIDAGVVDVSFPRDVSKCTWIATQGNPGDSFVPGVFATVRGNGPSSVVEVVTEDTTDTQVDANFHLAAIC